MIKRLSPFNRRKFLQLAVTAAAPTLFGALLSSCDAPSPTPQGGPETEPANTTPNADRGDAERILVIGAGMAGLAAARTLVDEGYAVTLLEGRDRIGGRVWTNTEWPNAALDMGASWIHGTEDNPITALAEDFGVKTLPTDYDNHTLFGPEGDLVSDEDGLEIESWFVELMDALDAERERRWEEDEPDISLGAAIRAILAEDDWEAEELQALLYTVNTTIEHEYAADVDDLSLFYWDEQGEFDGEDVIFPQGYGQIAQGLAKGLDVRLGHSVEKIAYTAKGVSVTTQQGTFTGAHAIITLPLGVLKQGRVAFDPPLPQFKQEAIERLGVNVLNKTYLRFPSAFWAEDVDTELFGYISEDKGEWCETLNMHYYTEAPILLMFNAGAYGTAIEALSDAQVVAAAMTTLRTIFGDDIPDPEAWLITRWGRDPFAYGSYSHYAPGATPDDVEALAEAVEDKLFFAGEATHLEHQATVHGAYLSGLRAAEEIMDL